MQAPISIHAGRDSSAGRLIARQSFGGPRPFRVVLPTHLEVSAREIAAFVHAQYHAAADAGPDLGRERQSVKDQAAAKVARDEQQAKAREEGKKRRAGAARARREARAERRAAAKAERREAAKAATPEIVTE